MKLFGIQKRPQELPVQVEHTEGSGFGDMA
jgi:hypothetical protein